MGRRRTIPRPNPDLILLRIAEQSEIECSAWRDSVMVGIRPERRDAYAVSAQKMMQHLADGWVVYDLQTFSGRNLSDISPSERQIWRQTLKAMEQDGTVEIFGSKATEVRLTTAGRRRLVELAKTEV